MFGNKKTKTEDNAALRQVYLSLTQLQRSHTFAQIKFNGDETVYQSMLLSVDPENQCLLIDDLFPRTDGFIGLQGASFVISFRDKGLTVNFNSKIVDRINTEGGLVYKITFPDSLDTQQRRSAFRLNVDNSLEITAHLSEQDLVARVIDISASGVRLNIEGEFKTVSEGSLLRALTVEFGGENLMRCNLDVRNAQIVEEPHRHVLIGGRFVNLAAAQKNQLEKYLIKAQRELRRRDAA